MKKMRNIFCLVRAEKFINSLTMRKLLVLIIFLLAIGAAIAADTAPPKISSQKPENFTVQVGDEFELSVICDDDAGLGKAVLYTNETGKFKAKQEEDLTGKTSEWVPFKLSAEQSNIGKTITWFVNVTDTSNNFNVSGNMSYQITDTIKPTPLNQTQSKDIIQIGEEIELSAFWRDKGGIKTAELEINDLRVDEAKLGANFTLEEFLEQNITEGTELTSGEITDKNFEAQSFAPKNKLLTAIELNFHRPKQPTGELIIEIRDSKKDEPDMNIEPLAKVVFPTENIAASGFYYIDFPDIELAVGRKYFIVVRSTVKTDIQMKRYNPQTYGGGENLISRDSGGTWIFSDSDLLFRIYSAKQVPTAFPTEAWTKFAWSRPDIKEEETVRWRIYAKDIAGNEEASEEMSFIIKTPECPEYCAGEIKPGECGELGECREEDGEFWKKQICYECGPDTNWKCKIFTNQTPCEIKVTRAEALEILSNAEETLKIARLSIPKLDLTKAEKLLTEAKGAYGDWEEVKRKAEQTIKAATEAPLYQPSECYEFEVMQDCLEADCNWYDNSCHKEPRPIGKEVIALVIIAIFGGVGGFLWRTGKLKLPFIKTEKVEEEEKIVKKGKEEKMERGICSICGETDRRLFTCKGCGTKACFKCVRRFKGKIYCLACLKKRGLV